jgi:hypothetical protein
MEIIMKLFYGDSTSGFGRATAEIGPRGAIRITSHDGDPRRVTKGALVGAVHQYLAGDPHPSVVTTAGDYLAARVQE